LTRSERWALLTILAGVALVYGIRMDHDHGWFDDSARYVWHALNLLEGRPYQQLNVGNIPGMAVPPVYPPGVPLLLAGVIPFTGVNFFAFKILMLAILLGCLALLPYALRTRISGWPAVGVTLWFGMLPEVWWQTQMVNSEGLNLLCTLGFLILVQEAAPLVEGGGWLRPTPLCAVAAGLLFTLALAARTSALPLLAGAFLYLVVLVRRHGTFSIVLLVTAVGGTLIIWQIPSGPTYFDQVRQLLSWETVLRNMVQYVVLCVKFLGGGKPAFAVVGILLATGAITVWRARGIGLWECWIAFYVVLIVLWPFPNPFRYGMPLMLLAMVYTAQGLDTVLGWLGSGKARVAGWAVVMALVGASYVHGYQEVREPGFFVPEAQEVFAFIREHTDPAAHILFRRPSILHLQTGRFGWQYPDDLAGDDLWASVCSRPVTHILLAPHVFVGDLKLLAPMVESRRQDFQELYQNNIFTLLTLKPGACAGVAPRAA
jgi:hypothetical protein